MIKRKNVKKIKIIESFEKPQNSLRSPLKTPIINGKLEGYSKSSIEKNNLEKNGESLEESAEPKKNMNKELYWVFGAMIGLIIIFLVSYSIFQSFKKIDYQGLTFKKEMFGQIPLYHYYYIGKVKGVTGGVISEQNRKVNLFLRNNPKENNISVDGEIVFPEGKSVYISIGNEGITECKYTVIGLATLSSFLSQNGIVVKAGVVDLEDAKANNLTHVSCEKYPENAVILIEKGDETKITKTGDYCYDIRVNNCETLPAIEKFIVQTLVDAKERAKDSGQYQSDVTLAKNKKT